MKKKPTLKFKKRQYTRNLYRVTMKNGYIRVNYIHNKSKGNPEDVIQLEILNEKQNYTVLNMRPDEAAIISGGLSFVTGLKISKAFKLD